MTQQIPALEADGATGGIWDRRPRAARAAFPSLESAAGLRSSLPSSGQTLLCPEISFFSLSVVFFKLCHFISLAQCLEHWLAHRSCSRTSSSLVRLVGWPGGQLRGLRTCSMAVAPFPGPSLHPRPMPSPPHAPLVILCPPEMVELEKAPQRTFTEMGTKTSKV